jgi:hypothetical protein
MNRCWLALGMVNLVLTLASLPDLLRQAALVAVRPPRLPLLLQRLDSRYQRPSVPARRQEFLNETGLFSALEQADRDWLPKAEALADGAIRYRYKRPPGEPELSIAEIKALMANPPSTIAERQAITDLLGLLQRSGVSVALSEPIKVGAAAEWDPGQRTLRIRPDVPAQGSIEFARVLNHEAIHVAQSCASGGLDAPPKSLGIATPLTSALAAQLSEPLYAEASAAEKGMEREAYAHQDQLGVGLSLVKLHCRDGRS